LSQNVKQIEELILGGAKRLLTRSANSRGLEALAVTQRMRAALDKYVLKDSPSATTQEVIDFLDRLHADDLCLVLACERGDQAAWNDLVEGYGTTVRSAARSASSNEAMADDLAQSIWAELHGLKLRDDGRPAGKLAFYSGVGSLGGWLRAVVGQLAIDQHRKQSRLVQPEEDTEIDRLSRNSKERDEAFSLLRSVANPEDSLASNLASADVEKALAQALRDLEDEDRLLVKLYYFDGLRLREAGAVLGVHEATASRRLTRIHTQVRERVGTILAEEHGWTKAESERCLAAIAVDLQGDIEPLLASTADSNLQSSQA
jgi:RNA polymerase sigma-70 factor (ECF subfamily)